MHYFEMKKSKIFCGRGKLLTRRFLPNPTLLSASILMPSALAPPPAFLTNWTLGQTVKKDPQQRGSYASSAAECIKDSKFVHVDGWRLTDWKRDSANEWKPGQDSRTVRVHYALRPPSIIGELQQANERTRFIFHRDNNRFYPHMHSTQQRPT